ncbi:MAG: VOC family protein [Planctomycetota bacterium]|nr:VOC family protein [Planctomycetota bacterium]
MPDKTNSMKMSVMLTCRDVGASLAFYRDKLGFQVDSTWPSADAPQWASVSTGGQSVMLGGVVSAEQAGTDAHHRFYAESSAAFAKAPGGGLITYLQVADVDGYFAELKQRGVELPAEPRDEFYGLRNFPVRDLDGYRLYFFQPIQMESCQSCGMPLADAKPGQTYCPHCSDEAGNLKPYEAVFEGTVQGYFMGMQGMPREAAEAAATEHLSKMPAWNCHS